MQRTVIRILTVFFVLLFVLGTLFRIMHYPGATIMRFIGLPGSVIGIILLFSLKRDKPQNTNVLDDSED